ncbi:MAG TPA: GH3 auxin-responsive promoter family protein [Opitutaceae bacterium]|nr:GH3 auxin-responsive promoter family protein [Opitutaceae bacterium]
MTTPRDFLIKAAATGLTARVRRRLRRSGAGHDEQHEVFAQLMPRLAATKGGRAAGLEAGMNYTQFQRRVPLRTYEDFAPDIERMKRGEPDVLWPGRCTYFAVSSGTTAGRTKYLPVTPELLKHFRRAGLDSLFYYTARTGRADVFLGRHLFLGGSSALTPVPERAGAEPAYAGDLSGITARHLPRWVEKILYEPGREIARMSDWPAKVAAIAGRTWSRDITLLAGIPSWVLVLAEALRFRAASAGRTIRHLQELWPNLQCFVHGGVPVGPFLGELRGALGPTVNFHEVYPASEGFIATQDTDSTAGLRLMTGVGLFYEFLPLARYDEAARDRLGPAAVPLEGVKPDIDYVLLLTTPAGLCRYVIGDVVRFVSTGVPRLVYAGRTKLQLSAFGEHVIEKELTEALQTVSQRHGWTVANFHVAPMFVDSAAGARRGRHEWWIELKPATGNGANSGTVAVELDREVALRNDDYEAKRQGGGLETPRLQFVAPGTFERWMREHGKWGGQSKMPRCRSDRSVADALRALAAELGEI